MAVVYDESPSMFRNNPLGFIAAVILIPVAVGIVILVYWYIKVRSLRLLIEGDGVHIERGFLSKEQLDIDVKKIRTVVVFQTLWGRMMDVGRIEIFTGGDDAECVLEGMPRPNMVRDYIRTRALQPDPHDV